MTASSPKEAAWLGPVVVVTVLALSAGVGYFQFVYLPATQLEEEIPPEWLSPTANASVQIVPGASLQTQAENFVPNEITVVLGANNTVFWRNNDTASHTVTSGTFANPGGSSDRTFDASASRSNFLRPKAEGEAFGGDFTFTFTRPGLYPYHCQPHPWMVGRIAVVPPVGGPSDGTNTTTTTTTPAVTDTTNTTTTAVATTATSSGLASATVLPVVVLASVAFRIRRPEP